MWRPTFPQIVIISIALQLAAQWFLPESIFNLPHQDIDGYAAFARTIATAGVYGPEPLTPSAFRPPLYPFLLAPWFAGAEPKAWGIILIHLAALVAILFALKRMAWLIGKPECFPLAGLLCAIDPLLLRQSTLIMTESVFTALFLHGVTFWIEVFHKERPAISTALKAGILTGLAALTRPIAWLYALSLLPTAAYAQRTKYWLLGMGAVAVVVAPWVIRNAIVLGHPIVTTTHGGYTLWLGQNPVYYREVIAGEHDIWPEETFQQWTDENRRATHGLTERQRDQYFTHQAVTWIRAHPAETLHSMAYHVRSLWSLAPRYGPEWGRVLCTMFYGVVFSTAILGMLHREIWQLPGILLPLALLAFTACHAVYWSDMRMRTPLEPILTLLASIGCASILAWFRKVSPKRVGDYA